MFGPLSNMKQCKSLLPEYDRVMIGLQLINRIASEYKSICTKNFYDGVVCKGVKVFLAFMHSFVNQLFGMHFATICSTVSTCCWLNKFSMHLKCNAIHFDLLVLSLPLFVFEAACTFVQKNLQWLIAT